VSGLGTSAQTGVEGPGRGAFCGLSWRSAQGLGARRGRPGGLLERFAGLGLRSSAVRAMCVRAVLCRRRGGRA
jgi:hypothetical protein